jgi:hypothetical protein
MQARGEHNLRDFDKYICRLPIPLYDPDIGAHRQLVTLAEQAETVAAMTEAPARMPFKTQRRRIRDALSSSGIGQAINGVVSDLLTV